MPVDGVIAAKIITCESVLTETNGVPSAIRILDILTLPSAATSAHFFAITNIHNKPFDSADHVLSVRMARAKDGQWDTVARADDYKFRFGQRLSLIAPGACVLTTEFNVTLAPLGELGTFYLQAWLDGVMVAQTPVTLRRAG